MKDSTSSHRVEFKPPKDFRPPENADPDKDWDMVCSFRTSSDGKICMTKLGDTSMPGYGGKEDGEEAKETEHKPDYSDMAQELANTTIGPNSEGASAASTMQ